MTSSKPLRYAIQVFLIAFALFLVVAGEPLSSTFRNVMRFSSVIPLAILAFETWIWHWPIVQRWSWFPVPDVRGTWKGTTYSTFKREDGSAIDPIESYMVIRQSLFWISVRQFTEESSSQLISGTICTDQDGVQRLNAIFLNTPNAGVRHRSDMSHGAFMYAIEGSPVKAFSGSYWTDRKTSGDARFAERVKHRAHSLEEAARLYTRPETEVVVDPREKERVNVR